MSRRIAGAPITWGVCEVPGWGHQLDPDRVLGEMSELGLEATELGPDGFLPVDPTDLRELLDRHGLRLVGGFIPVVLHDRDAWKTVRPDIDRRLATLARGGAEVAVAAAATGRDGYEGTTALADGDWDALATSLRELESMADANGIRLTVHPHYGTVIETPEAIEHLLHSSDVDLCLDTGHVLVGGGDPVALARDASHRIGHVHLKDVDASLADRVRRGEVSYHAAVAEGLYRPLGEGDVDLAAIVGRLDRAGYDGWYVLEQDVVLTAAPPVHDGPYLAAARSRRYLTDLPLREAGRNGASAPPIGKEGST